MNNDQDLSKYIGRIADALERYPNATSWTELRENYHDANEAEDDESDACDGAQVMTEGSNLD